MSQDYNNIKILVTRNFPGSGTSYLKELGFDIVQWEKESPMTHVELIENAQGCQAIFCTLTEKIDKEVFEKCPDLKVISTFAVGYDNIDTDEATKRGIPVGHTPYVLSEATGDLAFTLMVSTARKVLHNHKSILQDKWKFFVPEKNLGMELQNKTLGVFGLGRIGVEMAKKCKGAYNMDIIYHNKRRNLEAEKLLNARYVNFDELLTNSDVVSAHCPINNETKNIFNKEAFAKMKTSSIFINTARGLVHNEEDLTEALKNGEIWGAGLDVTNPEPMHPNNPLLNMDNVTVLPHIGSATQETRDKMSMLAAENIVGFIKDSKMKYVANPEYVDYI